MSERSQEAVTFIPPSTSGSSPSEPTFTQPTPATNSTVTSVDNPNDGSTVTLIAAAATPINRRGVAVCNDQGALGTANLLLKLGAAASTTSFTVKMAPNDYYEVPFTYVGVITAVWDANGGAARVTEITP